MVMIPLGPCVLCAISISVVCRVAQGHRHACIHHITPVRPASTLQLIDSGKVDPSKVLLSIPFFGRKKEKNYAYMHDYVDSIRDMELGGVEITDGRSPDDAMGLFGQALHLLLLLLLLLCGQVGLLHCI